MASLDCSYFSCLSFFNQIFSLSWVERSNKLQATTLLVACLYVILPICNRISKDHLWNWELFSDRCSHLLPPGFFQDVVRLVAERVFICVEIFVEMEPDLLISSHQPDTEGIDFGSSLIRLKVTDQIKELQTVLRDR